MLYLSTDSIAKYCYSAGFRGTALEKAIAVIYAESGGDANSVNVNTNGSKDWGMWQINSAHKGVTQVLAFDPAWASRFAWNLSKQGTNFTPWYGYTNGNYLKYMIKATVVAADIDPTVPPLNIVSLWTCRAQVGDGLVHHQVKIIQKALVGEKLLPSTSVDGVYGLVTIAAYKKLQANVLRLALAVCDGKPGTTSLNYLSKKYGFTWVN